MLFAIFLMKGGGVKEEIHTFLDPHNKLEKSGLLYNLLACHQIASKLQFFD
jgi:hypothetical protein